MDDAALAYKAQQGDKSSFEILVRRHAGSIANYLRRFMPDGDDKDDLFQEVFLKAYLNMHCFDPAKGCFHSWLLRIAANTSLDELKRRRREDTRNAEAARALDYDPVKSPDRMERIETVEVLRSALMSLPDSERQVILLSFYHDLKYREISGILDVPLGTVKSRMRSAMSSLRQVIAMSEVGDLR